MLTDLRIRPYRPSDLSAGLRLKSEAGWNQLERDWQRVAELQPDGCFVAELDGVGVGTVVTTIFGSTAWLGLMLVTERLRGQGIGRRLMDHALAFLDRQCVPTVRLDATPMGEPLYASLGFQPDFALTRFLGEGGGTALDSVNEPPRASDAQDLRNGIFPITENALPELFSLDQAATGIDRHRLLDSLWRDDSQAGRMLVRGGRVEAFLLERPGCLGRQLGPCIGRPSAGELLADAIRRFSGKTVIVDIPNSHEASIRTVSAAGLAPRRSLLRMTRGPRVAEVPARIWASFGPEKG